MAPRLPNGVQNFPNAGPPGWLCGQLYASGVVRTLDTLSAPRSAEPVLFVHTRADVRGLLHTVGTKGRSGLSGVHQAVLAGSVRGIHLAASVKCK